MEASKVKALILKEIRENQSQNEIFCYQESCNLKEFQRVIHEEFPIDLCVSFTPKNLEDVISFVSMDRTNAHQVWEHYASFQILKEQAQRDAVDCGFPLDFIEGIFLSHQALRYEKVQDQFPTYKDVIAHLNPSNIGRLHLFLDGINSTNLQDALTPYLSASFTHPLMLYIAPNGFYTGKISHGFPQENEWIWQAYDYVMFNKKGEFVPSIKHEVKQKQKIRK